MEKFEEEWNKLNGVAIARVWRVVEKAAKSPNPEVVNWAKQFLGQRGIPILPGFPSEYPDNDPDDMRAVVLARSWQEAKDLHDFGVHLLSDKNLAKKSREEAITILKSIINK
jgi:hypothetical protein